MLPARFIDALLHRMERSNDKRFLGAVHRFERELAKLLALLLSIVIALVAGQLVLLTAREMVNLQVTWFDGGLMKLLDRLLLILIALEVLQNVTAYLRDHTVQIELVLLTALTAVARKVIVPPQGSEDMPTAMLGFGGIVVALAVAYWLVRQAQAPSDQASSSQPQG